MNQGMYFIQRMLSPRVLVALSIVVMVFMGYARADAFSKGSHLDRSKLPLGCSSCHKGHGESGTMMLQAKKGDLCFGCHGPVKGKRKGQVGPDIYSELSKQSRHPVIETSHYHVNGEELPERSSAVPRHVACFDCHNVHRSTKENKVSGVRGYTGKGHKTRASDQSKEYEVCYLCHSDSANAPPESSDISEEFNIRNPSFHPLETVGKNKNVPSLLRDYNTSSRITCSDCHGSDTSFGPQGPHGSNYPPILKYRYEMRFEAESPLTYELCYSCHDRTSILNDESFKSHKSHVVYSDSPCSACHDSHGSALYTHLIHFDDQYVFPNANGELAYITMMPGRPKCLLSCHVKGISFDHTVDSGSYCINGNCLPAW